MIERDYIMRMISMLATFLARALLMKRARDFPHALTELDQAGRTLVGVDSQMVALLSAEQLMSLFGSDTSLALPKAYVLGVLLQEQAEVLRQTAAVDEARRVLQKALHLLTATYLDARGPIDEAHPRQIQDAIRDAGDGPLPPPLLVLLVRYWTMAGRFDRAENVLFELLELDVSSVTFAESFYRGLLAKSDADLEAGCLPRAEIETGLMELVQYRSVRRDFTSDQ